MYSHQRGGRKPPERHSYVFGSIRQTVKSHNLGWLRDGDWQSHSYPHFRFHSLFRALDGFFDVCNQRRNRMVGQFHKLPIIEL